MQMRVPEGHAERDGWTRKGAAAVWFNCRQRRQLALGLSEGQHFRATRREVHEDNLSGNGPSNPIEKDRLRLG